MTEPFQRAIAAVDLSAIEHNTSLLAERAAPAEVCAVVKADGYGHGAAECAGAALLGGATRLGVASATEAWELRRRFADAPIVVLGALTAAEIDVALHAGAELTVWRRSFWDLVLERSAELGVRPRIHVKHDSGMGRLGTRDSDDVAELVELCASSEGCAAAGVWTHFATADETDSEFFGEQLERFTAVAERAREIAPEITVHAANSAATLRDSAAHFDMVRCGIAIYGLDPFGRDPSEQGLRPALELRSYLADVKRFEPGDSAGYGRRWRAERPTSVGVIPVGYGDGYRRGLTNNASVLIEGRRYPVVGTVSMDNITVDLGAEPRAKPGAEVVLIGAQGDERIAAEELASALDTINYEITCGISQRVPRSHAGRG